MKPRKTTGRIVYSTELGRTCPNCGRALNLCTCATNRTRILGDGNVRVGRESQGRGGKVVTTITGLPVNLDDLTEIASTLKRKCGTGGTVKDGVIEIQGDHRDTIMVILQGLNYRPKRTGG